MKTTTRGSIEAKEKPTATNPWDSRPVPHPELWPDAARDRQKSRRRPRSSSVGDPDAPCRGSAPATQSGQGASTSRTTALPAASKARTATTCGPGPAGSRGAMSASTVSSAVSKIPSTGSTGRHSSRPSIATSTRAMGPMPSTTSARSRRPVTAMRLEDRRRVVDAHRPALERVMRHVVGRVRDLVARVDAQAVAALRERRRVPLELRLREHVVRPRRVDPAGLPFAPELHAIAELVAVGVVDLPRDVHDAVVLGRLAAARGQPLLRLVRRALLVRLHVGHHGAQVLGRERDGHVGDRRDRVAQARAHLHEAPGGARRGPALGDRALPGAPRRVGRARVARARRDLERARPLPREVPEARTQPGVERLARPHRVRARRPTARDERRPGRSRRRTAPCRRRRSAPTCRSSVSATRDTVCASSTV